MHAGVEEGDWQVSGTYGLRKTERQDGSIASVRRGRMRIVNLSLHVA